MVLFLFFRLCRRWVLSAERWVLEDVARRPPSYLEGASV